MLRRWLVASCLLSATAASAGDTLDAVKARGELVWGADAQGGAPFVFQDPMDPNHLIGFEVDLADALAAKLSVKARPFQAQWDTLLETLGRGDVDVALNGLEVADEKLRVCRLSKPYFVAAEKLAVRRNDPSAPRSLAALAGRRVGTLTGALPVRILERAGATPVTYEGGQEEIYEDLRLGRTDAVLLDAPITRYYAEVHPELEVVDGDFGSVEYAVAVRKDDARLEGALNRALAELAADGTLARIYRKWGLWNEATARVLGVPFAGAPEVAEGYEAWRTAVEELPPFWTRVRTRYPSVLPLFARGAGLTLLLSLLSMAVAMTVGAALASARRYGPKPLRALAWGYVEAVRGTPLLVQLTIIYFGLPELGLKLSPFLAGVTALGLNYAAAEAENYRAGLESVAEGQSEAARVLGLTRWQTLRYVLAPQALRIALPPVTNDFIALLKDSSLVALVTLTELTKTYLIFANSMRDHLGLGALVALFYLGIGLPFAFLARRAESALRRGLLRGGA